MTARSIVLTGASDGIGAAAARLLVAGGDDVLLVGRSPDKTAALARELRTDHLVADFARLDDVRALADRIRERRDRIDVLANNAGGVFGDRTPTADGNEKTFQVNHLAPFLLTNLLMGTLLESRAAVVNTASVASRSFGHLDLHDLDNARKYSANKAYGDAKLANILFTRSLHARFHERGLSSVAFHPGVVRTNFAADTPSWLRFAYRGLFAKLFMISPEKGGETLAWFIDGTPGDRWISGEYYDERVIATRVNPQIHDEALRDGLWARSAELVGVRPGGAGDRARADR